MQDFIEQCVAVLRAAGQDLRPGLTSSEISGVQHEFGFTFSPDHAALLTSVLPLGKWWIDWRQADRADIRSVLDWPADGTLFDVETNGFWPSSWGSRPEGILAALDTARSQMADVPTLIPIHSHRYMPAAPAPHLAPVFSVYQTDVVYYGQNLLDYFLHEFGPTGDDLLDGFLHRFGLASRHPTPGGRISIAFWSALAEGAENQEL